MVGRSVPRVEVHAPKYSVDKPPNYLDVGRKVDRAIAQGFPDGRYVLRALGVEDHPDLTVDQLATIVQETGTDKYDPERKPVGHDEFAGYEYDIQAAPVEIRGGRMVPDTIDPSPTVFGGIARHFYEGARIDRGRSVRIDLLVLYDAGKMVRARKRHAGAKGVRQGLNRFLYRFKDPADKPGALVGLVEILR